MRTSSDRILTSPPASLPRPDELIDANARREAGKADETTFQKSLTASVADVGAAGGSRLAVPGDGEFASRWPKSTTRLWSYSFDRWAA